MNDAATVPGELIGATLVDPQDAPRLHFSEHPADGWAELQFLLNPALPEQGNITWRVEGKPWHQLGKPPYAWRHLPPFGETKFHSIEMIAGRSVRVQQFLEKDGQRKRMRLGETPTGFLDRDNPFFDIIRPQNDGLIPLPDENYSRQDLVGPSFQQLEDTPLLARPDKSGNRIEPYQINAIQVVTTNTGIKVTNPYDLFEYTVRTEKRSGPGAFAYRLSPATSDEDDDGPVVPILYVIRSPGVRVESGVRIELERYVGVVEKVVDKIEDVPPQGADFQLTGFRHHESDFTKYGESLKTGIFVFEFTIGMVPFAGALYELGRFAHMASSGTDFFNQKVTDTDILISGCVVGLSILGSVGAASRMVRQVAKARKLDAAIQVETISRIKNAVDSALVDTAGVMAPKHHKQLAKALRRVDEGSMSLDDLLKLWHQLEKKTYTAFMRRDMVGRLFSMDLQRFIVADLEKGYQKYLSKPRYRKNPKQASDRLGWLKQQNRVKASRYRKIAVELLGVDYVKVINEAIKGGRIPRQVTRIDVQIFDRLAGVQDAYSDLRNAVRALQDARLPKGSRVADHFEIDHIMERRFLRNVPAVESSLDELSEGIATLIPKNEYVAAEIFRQFGGNRIRYVHTTKTRLLKRLIPDQAEALFAHHFGDQFVQKLWDAHADVLLRLDAWDVADLVFDEFDDLAKSLNQTVAKRVPDPGEFLPPNWPRIWKDAQGQWNIQ